MTDKTKGLTKLLNHPAADLFPMMDGEDLQALSGDIKKNGLRVSIKLHEGMILDGRNRLRACVLAGVGAKTEPASSGDIDPYMYVWSQNSVRRHLTPDQLTAIRVLVLERSGEWKRLKAEARAEANRKRQEQARARGELVPDGQIGRASYRYRRSTLDDSNPARFGVVARRMGRRGRYTTTRAAGSSAGVARQENCMSGAGFDHSLLDDLNDDDRGTLANLVQPALALLDDDDPEVRGAAIALASSVEAMLRTRSVFGRTIARAAGAGSRTALGAVLAAAGVEP